MVCVDGYYYASLATPQYTRTRGGVGVCGYLCGLAMPQHTHAHDGVGRWMVFCVPGLATSQHTRARGGVGECLCA